MFQILTRLQALNKIPMNEFIVEFKVFKFLDLAPEMNKIY